ncbi:MAG: dockerin type I domain-containing protein [Candidatus Bathyarchaeota archaeon]|nr:dockerin type I domain-containing protein [Candidatus Termiticorpusculum sp.]
MKPHKNLLKLSTIILFTGLMISLTPFTALAQTNPQTLNPTETNNTNLEGVGANFDDIVMPKANPACNGFIAPPNKDPVPVDAVHIQTAQQLAGIGGVQSAGKCYVLDNDINLVGEWVPIDDFRGVFDGRGYRVNDLYVLASSNRQYVGLFGQINVAGVVIKNVGINTGLNGITASASAYDTVYAGGLVGYNAGYGMVVENCYVGGNVSGDVTDYTSGYGTVSAGGLVGYDAGSGGLAVANCYVKCDVTVSGTFANVGGLIGFSQGGVTVENCYAEGNVTASVSTGYVGGLVGNNINRGVSMVNCFVVGDVFGSGTVGGLIGLSGSSVVVVNCFVVGDVFGSGNAGGLVGYCNDIVSVKNCYVKGSVSDPRYCVGGLVGYSFGVVVVDCFVVGDVFGSGSYVRVGGLVGYNYRRGGVVVKNCYVKGDVTVSSSGGSVYVGGLVGYNEIADSEVGYVVVENCYVVGDVTVSDSGSGGYVYMGGLVGHSYRGDVVVVDCFVVGDVFVFGSGSSVYVGGLVGYRAIGHSEVGGGVNVENCYVKGDVTVSIDSSYSSVYVGGLVGHSGGDANMVDCFVVGDVFGSSGSSGYKSYVGGLVGYSHGVVAETCFVVGDVFGSSGSDSYVGGLIGYNADGGASVETCFVVGDVSGFCGGYEVCVGGLVGYNDNGDVSVKKCYVKSDVIAGFTNADNSYARVGGLVGNNDYGSDVVVENCYVSGDVTSSYCAGGLVGDNYFDDVSLVNCYVTGNVFGSVFAGDLVGRNYNGKTDVKSCYRLATQQVSGSILSLEGTPLSVEAMQRQASFVGWNFANTWTINPNINGGFPYLRGLFGEQPMIFIVVQPENICMVDGSVSGSLVVEASITLSAILSYQWYQCLGATPDPAIDTQVGTDNIFVIPSDLVAGTYYYYCVVSATGAKSVTSNVAAVIFPTINVSSAVGKAGDEVTLTVMLENNPGIASYSLTMKHPSELEFVRAEQGNILTYNFRTTTTVDGQVSLSANSENGADVATGTTLFTITFKIGTDVENGTIIAEDTGLALGTFRLIDAVESSGKRISCVFNQGQIVVKNPLYGDANGDGFVDFLDVTRLLRYLWEVPDSTPFNAVNADTNGDGAVDFLDVTRLLRYLWEIDPSPLGPKQTVTPAFLFMPLTFNEPAVEVSNEICQAGDEVTLTVSLTNNPGIASFSTTMEYPDELTFIEAKTGDIINSNFRATADNSGVVVISATSQDGADVVTGSILFTVRFKVSENTNVGCIEGVTLGLFRPLDVIESKGERLGFNIVQGSVTVEKPPAVLVRATTSAKDFISITETSKNSGVWVLAFKVTEVYSNGETKIVQYAINIKANNANVAGSYDLDAYTLVYDIKGNGSNIREFRLDMNYHTQ